MNGIADLLGSVQSKGIRLWAHKGQLHYEAPKGALTEEEIERLRLAKGQLIAFLESAAGAQWMAGPDSAASVALAPLAYSQLAHWNLYQLSRRPAVRTVTSATRLCGRLNLDALRRSVDGIVRRHDALRTRIVVRDGTPGQEVSPSGGCELAVIDLRALPEASRPSEVSQYVHRCILEPVDVCLGPLFVARLLALADDEHVLIVSLEHLIADGFSLNLLARDLFAMYVNEVKGAAIVTLPAIQMQFSEYARLQRDAESSWVREHGNYWKERLAGCQRLRFPADATVPPGGQSGRGSVPIRIGRELKAELREWCRVQRTTVVMALFGAYVALVLRWCNASDGVFPYQTNARFQPEIENTVGYFAAVLYLRIGIEGDDCFLDLVNRATREYCSACEHADLSYIPAQEPRPDFARNTSFNWTPQGESLVDLSALEGSQDALTCAPVRFAFPAPSDFELDREPFILLCDERDEIVADLYFSLNRFSVQTMGRFAKSFVGMIERLVRRPEQRVKDVPLCG